MATFRVENFINTFYDQLEEPVRKHLKNVYSCVAISTLAAAVGGYVHLFTNIFQGGLLSALAGLAFLILLMFTPHDGKNASKRLCYLVGFAFATGLGLGPLMESVIMVNPQIISLAFLATSVIFISFTLCSLFSKRGSWLFLGGSLMSAISVMFLMGLVNLFTRSVFIYQMHLYLGLAVMCGFILYDTQLIIEKCRMGDRDFIWHSVNLFIDFVGVFRRLLILLTQKEESKKRRRD
ncbi:probable Bax inhibitor 1 [Limulus polyphemus]|uniref:Probable Bax inhibitor 1 n=1 Tax=Limulus polyphemus TaxID=6850 RepID=A0ABM1BZC8_LIMPO|nr:probable Bax inhibitor 1 [Limulus polyphemus]